MSKNTLYLECYEGITGKMVLEALKELAGGVEAEEGSMQGEILTQIDSLMETLQIEKITASPVWSDKGPTDAAGLAIAARSCGERPERFIVKKVGLGKSYVNLSNGTRAIRTLRAMLIEEEQGSDLWMLESNIDDCSGEIMGYTLELLFDAGARDAFFTPIFMKKNRPAYKLSVLCTEDRIRAIDEILFRETTTIGIRRYRVEREALKRRFFEVELPDGTVRIKACQLPDGATEKRYPEYEDIKKIARETGRSYREVYEEAKTEAEKVSDGFA
ncbi:LarC family nickel insertion protein [Anaerosacchariphilus sp. NSJ-68]|uniref:LarC family nickel insertion protein n=2 Tax=Lachnospiraceae TaxID=186803 RepID=A0A923LAB1_9FIRM|nr:MULTISPECIES: LarC family nickel insertion protein [Lachnospiraceae]MBC5658618.1 LarC family nickel insertion protein [Anaerosacchariphilus hominis]MBC5698173.1 LarC family nickel insertion protein [Roseburia difficilis]